VRNVGSTDLHILAFGRGYAKLLRNSGTLPSLLLVLISSLEPILQEVQRLNERDPTPLKGTDFVLVYFLTQRCLTQTADLCNYADPHRTFQLPNLILNGQPISKIGRTIAVLPRGLLSLLPFGLPLPRFTISMFFAPYLPAASISSTCR
jgi:hypothetical protein